MHVNFLLFFKLVIITLACRPSVLNPSFSVFDEKLMEFALGHRRLRVKRAPVTYSVQFQNGGFSLSDLIYISRSFVEFSKNCAGFLWILRYVALWPFLRVELVCFSLCNISKTPKFGPSEFIQYSGSKQGQVKGLTV